MVAVVEAEALVVVAPPDMVVDGPAVMVMLMLPDMLIVMEAVMGATAASYAPHVAPVASGQSSAMQMACSAGPWDLTAVAGGAQRMPKRPLSAMPTALRSLSATPNEAPERATCLMLVEMYGVRKEEGRRGTYLSDEVAQFRRVKVHELVDLVHGRLAYVGWEGADAGLGAAQEDAKELVQVGEEEAVEG